MTANPEPPSAEPLERPVASSIDTSAETVELAFALDWEQPLCEMPAGGAVAGSHRPPAILWRFLAAAARREARLLERIDRRETEMWR